MASGGPGLPRPHSPCSPGFPPRQRPPAPHLQHPFPPPTPAFRPRLSLRRPSWPGLRASVVPSLPASRSHSRGLSVLKTPLPLVPLALCFPGSPVPPPAPPRRLPVWSLGKLPSGALCWAGSDARTSAALCSQTPAPSLFRPWPSTLILSLGPFPVKPLSGPGGPHQTTPARLSQSQRERPAMALHVRTGGVGEGAAPQTAALARAVGPPDPAAHRAPPGKREDS